MRKNRIIVTNWKKKASENEVEDERFIIITIIIMITITIIITVIITIIIILVIIIRRTKTWQRRNGRKEVVFFAIPAEKKQKNR